MAPSPRVPRGGIARAVLNLLRAPIPSGLQAGDRGKVVGEKKNARSSRVGSDSAPPSGAAPGISRACCAARIP